MKNLASISALIAGLLLAGPAHAVNGRGLVNEAVQLAKASVALVKPLDESLTCSGVLISRRQAMTAAHCVDESKPMMVKFEGFEPIKVREAVLHPIWTENLPRYREFMKEQRQIDRKYNRILRRVSGLAVIADDKKVASMRAAIELDAKLLQAEARKLILKHNFPGDIAILELEEDAPAGLRPVSLDYDFRPGAMNSTKVVLAGYGTNGWGTAGELNLAEANVIGTRADTFVVGGSGVICPGDSGGMTARIGDGQFHLVAVNSEMITPEGGIDCTPGHSQGYVTKISDYKIWIQTYLKL